MDLIFLLLSFLFGILTALLSVKGALKKATHGQLQYCRECPYKLKAEDDSDVND